MTRIGLLGNKGSGKDTLADYLVEEKDFVKFNFADPIKDILKIMFGLNDDQLYGDKKEVVDPRYNLTPRTMFQKFGTDFGQFKIYELFPELKDKIKPRTLWLNVCSNFIDLNKDKNIVIADVRFHHEVEFLRTKGFNIIEIKRNSIKKDNHISENEIKEITDIDFTIDNNSTKQDLFKQYDDFIYVPF